MTNLGYEMANKEKRMTRDEIEGQFGKDFFFRMKQKGMIQETKRGNYIETTKKFEGAFRRNTGTKIYFKKQGGKHFEATRNFSKLLDKETKHTIKTENTITDEFKLEKRHVSYKNAVAAEEKRVRQDLIDARDKFNADYAAAKAAGKSDKELHKMEKEYQTLIKSDVAQYKALFHVKSAEHLEDPSKEIQKTFSERKPITSTPDARYTFNRDRLERFIVKMEDRVSRFEMSMGHGDKDRYHKYMYEQSLVTLRTQLATLTNEDDEVDINVEHVTSSYSAEDHQRHLNYSRFTGRPLIVIPPK